MLQYLQYGSIKETSGKTRRKWNDLFRSNRAKQEESDSYVPCFIPYPKSYITEESVAMKRFGKNGSANFRRTGSDRNKWTTRGDPEYSGRKKPK